MIQGIADFFNIILSEIYKIVPNLGVTIIIFTVIVKLATFPLNNQQIKSAKRMQELQPEIKKIQQKFKNDKEKQNRAVMEFMQENKINPLAGCLPLLVQFPILIGIFTLLREIKRFGIAEIPGFNEFLIPSMRFLDLTASNHMEALYVIPILAAITTYTYSKLTMTDPNQKFMLYLFPGMILLFSAQMPSGLVIYWTVTNLFSMLQHRIINMGKKKEEIKSR